MEIKWNPVKVLDSVLANIFKGVPAMYSITALLILSIAGWFIFGFESHIGKWFFLSTVFFGSLWVMLFFHGCVRRVKQRRDKNKIYKYIPNEPCENFIFGFTLDLYPQIVWTVCYKKPSWTITDSIHELKGRHDPRWVDVTPVKCANCKSLFKIGLRKDGNAVLKCPTCGIKVVVLDWSSTKKNVKDIALGKLPDHLKSS